MNKRKRKRKTTPGTHRPEFPISKGKAKRLTNHLLAMLRYHYPNNPFVNGI